jgi:hypothetical protein
MNRLFEEFVYHFIDRHRTRILPDGWRDVLRLCRGHGRHLAERLPGRRKWFAST